MNWKGTVAVRDQMFLGMEGLILPKFNQIYPNMITNFASILPKFHFNFAQI